MIPFWHRLNNFHIPMVRNIVTFTIKLLDLYGSDTSVKLKEALEIQNLWLFVTVLVADLLLEFFIYLYDVTNVLMSYNNFSFESFISFSNISMILIISFMISSS